MTHDNHMVTTGTLQVDGTLANVRQIDPSKCPHCIFSPEHYRDDGTCKCDDPKETVMREWGYRWSKRLNRWAA